MLRSSGGPGVDVLPDAVVGHLDDGAGHQVRVDHRVHGPVLETPRSRDPKAGGAVLVTPVREHRRPESRVPQPPVRVDGGAADRGQRPKVGDDAADDLQAHLARQLRVVGVGHEGVLSPAEVGEVVGHAGKRSRVVAQRLDRLLPAPPEADVVVAARGRDPHEGLGHEAGDEVVLARDLGADLAVGGEAVRGAQRVVEREVEFQLPRRVLVVALDHVEPHRPRVLDGPQVHRPQALELVDVVAVGVREPAVGLAVRAALEPHHLRLGAVAQVQPAVLGLELLMDATEVAAAVRGEERARVLALLPVAEQRAPQPRHPLVPGELAEGLRLRDAHQLLVLRAVAQVLAVAVEEEVDRRAVDELEAPLGDALPVVGGDPLAADSAGDRHELEVQVLDAEPVDHLSDLPDLIGPSGCFHEAFDVHRHSSALPRSPVVVSPLAVAGLQWNHDQFNTKTQPIYRDWYPESAMAGTLSRVAAPESSCWPHVRRGRSGRLRAGSRRWVRIPGGRPLDSRESE